MSKGSRRRVPASVRLVFAAVLLAGCSTIECPLNNTVVTNYALGGEMKTLTSALTITADIGDGNDSVVLNRASGVATFSLPISHQRPADTFFLAMARGDSITEHDTIVVFKTDVPHFESVDCAPAFFHTITGVDYTRHAIDSVVINNPNVSYDVSQPTFKIYFKSNIR